MVVKMDVVQVVVANVKEVVTLLVVVDAQDVAVIAQVSVMGIATQHVKILVRVVVVEDVEMIAVIPVRDVLDALMDVAVDVRTRAHIAVHRIVLFIARVVLTYVDMVVVLCVLHRVRGAHPVVDALDAPLLVIVAL